MLYYKLVFQTLKVPSLSKDKGQWVENGWRDSRDSNNYVNETEKNLVKCHLAANCGTDCDFFSFFKPSGEP